MRMSSSFGRTLREAPSEAELTAHQLILRAGLARQLLAGGMALLPLGMRVFRRIEALMHAELAAIGAGEFRTPVVHAASLWQQTGRYAQYGEAMLRFENRNQQALLFAPTHEEAVAELARREVDSYRQLPSLLYQIHTKYRDELRVRGGLLRLREFTMLDAYSLDADWAGLDAVYDRVALAFETIFERCGVRFTAVEADGGEMGGREPREYMAFSGSGEDTLVVCQNCNYAANSEVAVRGQAAATNEIVPAMSEIATPACTTIAELATFLQISEAQTAKAVFFNSEKGLIFVVVRGDREVNEIKLRAAAGVSALEAATLEQISAVGAVAGYASPVGLTNVTVIADHSVVGVGGLVAGANRSGYHLQNVVYGRDWQATIVADIANVEAGDACPSCGASLSLERGIEIGHIFKLGTRYTEALGATYLDPQGQAQPIVMGSYGIGLERLLQVIIEQHHDEKGIVWPASVAPFDLHLVQLGASATVSDAANQLYEQLNAAGVSVLYDDRNESAGVKFNDADLLGMPWRLTVGERGLKQQVVELRNRATGVVDTIGLDEVVTTVKNIEHRA
ncbi:proline--tRNA ligase [Herpetosiphon giganteus]|uniref:proline--tRNA ligase n=1 Tax=Herpetosiphon giganteus TaxID=2029754 RepID=UPI001955F712|nr:proline--tRNA ligase [Herpetosiphon giganteus]MBM7843076.1 prolyl-tRNA synthetase [Herpetosiphon giganteus]